MVASQDDDGISDEELLTGTGSGGMFASGYLSDQPLIEYLGESERVSYLLSNTKKGVREESDDGSTAYTPGDGYQAIAAVTDTRVLFVVGDCSEDGDEMFGVPYTEIEDVKTNRGVLKKSVDVWTTSGVRWRFFVKSGVEVGPAAEYLERAAVVWSRVEGQLQHARKYVAAISDHATEGDHEQAREAATTAREYVEEARRKAAELTEDREDAIWDRIETTERRLEKGVLDIHVSRADGQVATAERKWQAEQYNDAYDSFLAARNQYELALDIAREQDLPEADDIRTWADEVTQRIDQLSKSPLQRAEDTYERARAAEDLDTTIELLAESLETYQSALVLDWGNEDQRFAGDSETIRTQIEAVVGDLVGARRDLAEKRWRAGDWFSETGEFDRARSEYEAAREHVEAALSVARELDPDLEPALADDLTDLDAAIERLTDRSNGADRESGESGERDSGDGSDEFGEVVARLWAGRGWETATRAEGVVDVVATRDHPIPEKQLVVAHQCGPDGTCDRTVVESAADTRDSDGDADVVAVLTDGSVTDDARSVARERNVKLLDGDRLADALDAAGIAGLDGESGTV
ncbi:restriction endonuclease [Halorientalis salina]|uniref:restriction endonuclease n=1 Tax=Halorientalis salina TaxID=2932266 RepID=UPI0010AD5942|nr:restriction endonuclease [Halorientalis salina]